jgi:hypothetical protein
MPNKIFELARRSLPKLRIKDILLFILAAGIVAALFMSPIQGQKASAAPPSTVFRVWALVELMPMDLPPGPMCVGDKAPISFSYKISRPNPAKGGTLEPATRGADGTLVGKATGGTLSKTSWDLSGGMGSGTITTTYTATKAGDGQIDISVGGGNIIIGGVSSFGPFILQECDRTLALSASSFTTSSEWNMDTEFNAKGGLKTAKDGTVTGGGTFTYTLTVTYNNTDPDLTCDQPGKMVGNDHFTLVNGSVVKGASGGNLIFGLVFDPFTYKEVHVICHDKKGVTIDKRAFMGGTVDPESDLPELQHLVFQSGETHKTFSWGDGSGSIWLIKRKGSGK